MTKWGTFEGQTKEILLMAYTRDDEVSLTMMRQHSARLLLPDRTRDCGDGSLQLGQTRDRQREEKYSVDMSKASDETRPSWKIV
jgi:hypothetical protein